MLADGQGGGYEESYNDFASSGNFPPMGIAPGGMQGGVPDEFSIQPSINKDDAPFF